MIRIAHTADIHLDEFPGPSIEGKNGRMIDIINCMNFYAEYVENPENKIDLAIVAGDLTEESKMWADKALRNMNNVLYGWLKRLASRVPTVVISGTLNHDNIEMFNTLKLMGIPNLYVVTEPQLLTINFVNENNKGRVQVGCIPGYDKAHFRAANPGMNPEDENLFCSGLLGDIVLGLSTERDPKLAGVLVAHYTVIGAELDGNKNSVFTKSDVVLPSESIAASGFDLVCLGHIHKAQKVNNRVPVYYSGTLTGTSFNEEGQDKGFWVHSIDQYSSSDFVVTPYRAFKTIELDDWCQNKENLENMFNPLISYEAWFLHKNDILDIKDKIVRVKYTITDEQAMFFDRSKLEEVLYNFGAYYVQEIKPEKIIDSQPQQVIEMSEMSRPEENLRAWLVQKGYPEDEIADIIEISMPIIARVSASMPSGKLSGLFMPKKIMVENYRSYKKEEFDFSKVHFATVNGKNGVGKSALFMDAIRECLFEKTRESDGKEKVDVTSWINNKAQSGMICFIFGMGDTDWRVTRTRNRSNKTTLALDEWIGDKWEKRSETKTADTQLKIENLLGMDATTFTCCALIMQDQYGQFMESDKTRRMEVLASAIGLGPYEQFVEETEKERKPLKRDFELKKIQLDQLYQALQEKPELEMEVFLTDESIANTQQVMTGRQTDLDEAKKTMNQLQVNLDRAADLQKQMDTIQKEIEQKEWDINDWVLKKADAENLLAAETSILGAVSELETVNEKIAQLEQVAAKIADLEKQIAQLTGDLDKKVTEHNNLSTKIAAINTELSMATKYEEAAVEWKTLAEEFDQLQDKKKKFDEYATLIAQANGKVYLKQAAVDAEVEKFANQKKDLQKKVVMLGGSNCIDIEKAGCVFLADAKQAKTDLDILETAQPIIDTKELEEAKVEVNRLLLEQMDYAIESNRLTFLKAKMLAVKPDADKAAGLEGKRELKNTYEEQQEKVYIEVGEFGKRKEALEVERDEQLTIFNEKPIDEYRALKTKNEPVAKRKEALLVAKEMYNTYETQRASAAAEKAAKVQQKSDLAVIKKSLEDNEELFENAQFDVENLTKEIKGYQDDLNADNQKLGRLKARMKILEEHEVEAEKVKAEVEPIAKKISQLTTLIEAFGMDGIPFAIVRVIVPEMRDQANKILWEMTGGNMSLDIKDSRVQKSNNATVNAIEVYVTDAVRGTMPYASRSGGQRVKAALAVAIALAMIKAQRAGIRLGMIFIDEPPFMDDEGKKAYCDTLELMANKFPDMKILAISHEGQMKARFPQQIDVTDDIENGSKAVLSVA